MARTPAQIISSYQVSANQSDPSADTLKGPLFDVIATPLSVILPQTEADVDNLELLYSSEFASAATAQQALAFTQNWGQTAGTGKPSKALVYFMKFSRPATTDVFDIPAGTLVSNSDLSLQYITQQDVQIRGDQANAIFNPQRRTYEVSVLVQATENGSAYDLPEFRINTIVATIPGIDAVENRADASGGEAAETQVQQVGRVQTKFSGTAINTPSGELSRIQAYDPSLVQDVKVVTPSNRKLFRRIVFTPAMDYYILGSDLTPTTETYTSVAGGETLIPLQNVPTASVSAVSINGTPISNFTLVQDTTAETGFSARAADMLLLSTPLIQNDTVSITLVYDALIQGVQQNVFTDTRLYNTDELARQFRQVPVVITITGSALPGFDPDTLQQEILAELQTILQPGVWTQYFYPNTVEETIESQVDGVSNLNLTVFHRLTLATSQIETVINQLNEISTYDPGFINIQISAAS